MLVADRPCSQCPFVGNLGLRPGRLADILAEVARKDSHFVCHKTLAGAPGRIARDATCRGYWDLASKGRAHAGQLVRIAQRLRIVRFVAVEPPQGAA